MLQPQNSVIISFNYDVIFDLAISKREDPAFNLDRADVEVLGEGDPSNIDYVVNFANMPPASDSNEQLKLLKLHGSFNWVASALTGNLYFGGLKIAVGAVMDYQASLGPEQQQAAEG